MRNNLINLILYFPLQSLVIMFIIAGCGDQSDDNNGRLFVVRVVDERFIIRLVTSEQMATARAILSGTMSQQIVIGKLADGDGGFNRDPTSGRKWSWHLIAETVSFAEVAIELCDGKPSHIEGNKSYWLETVGEFCPFSSQVEAELNE
jgi:hypothetical protein